MTGPFQDSLGFRALCSCVISSVLVCYHFQAFLLPEFERGKHINSSKVHSWEKAVISHIIKYPLGLDLKYVAVEHKKFRSDSLAGRMLPQSCLSSGSPGWGLDAVQQTGLVLSTPLCSSTTLGQVSEPEGSNPLSANQTSGESRAQCAQCSPT